MLTSKGMGTDTIMKLTLALMVAALFIGAGTLGSLGQAIIEGFNDIKENTNYQIEVKDKQTLSDAALFVRHRAGYQGCSEDNGKDYNTVYQQVENDGGYPALADTYIGRYPTCEGAAATVARGPGSGGLGKDQEGIYSRVSFRATKKLEFSSNGDTWLEQRLKGSARGTIGQNTVETCSTNALEEIGAATASGTLIGAVSSGPIGAFAGGAIGFLGGVAEQATDTRFVGTGDKFILFVLPEDMDNRVNGWLSDADGYSYGERIYCYGIGEELSNADISNLDISQSPLEGAFDDHYGGEFEWTLCPGDEGYIQMNKNKPQEDGEAGAGIVGDAENFPHIVITEKGEDCT